MNGGANVKEKLNLLSNPFTVSRVLCPAFFFFWAVYVNHRHTTISNSTIYYENVYTYECAGAGLRSGGGYSSTHANTFVDNNTQFSFRNREWCISVSVYQ